MKEMIRSKIWILILALVLSLSLFLGFTCKGKTKGEEILPTKKETSSEETVSVPNGVIELQEAFANVAQVVKPAVVNISAVHILKMEVPYYQFYFGDPFEDFFDEFFGRPRERKREPKKREFKRRLEGTGSGVIIDPKGYILTNYHVIAGAEEIKVTLSNGKERKYDGKVIGKDPRTDLAIIKIKSKEKFPAAKLGDSDKIRIGDWAIAIGSPFGLKQTLTVGVISAKRQSLYVEGKQYREMIQTDASINRGNSGGPLVNIKGEVIGINTAIYAPTGVFAGVGFAIPINNAKEIIDELIEKGRVVRGWLGIEIREVDEVIAKQFNLPNTKGVLVNRVIEDSAAEKGGMKRGDIIIKIGGHKVEDVRDLQKVVTKTKPGKKVKVMVIREKKEVTLSIKLGEMPEPTEEARVREKEKEEIGEGEVEQWLGMKVETLTTALVKRYGIDDGEGVVIVEIEIGSKAEEMGLVEGDLIRSVNRQSTGNCKEFKKVVKKADLSEGVIFDIVRRGRPVYITYMERG
ncbi:Periplasmic serine endoprotease DegP [subsurface metagenome]|nr:Do family serine endopeptidase [Clostridia bacterium]